MNSSFASNQAKISSLKYQLKIWVDTPCSLKMKQKTGIIKRNYYYYYFLIYLSLAVLGLRFRARALSSCGKRGPLFIAVRGPLTVTASPVAEHRLQTRKLSNCGSRAQLLRGMWDLPGPRLEPVSPALAGRLSTTTPPGKPKKLFFKSMLLVETSCKTQYNKWELLNMSRGESLPGWEGILAICVSCRIR